MRHTTVGLTTVGLTTGAKPPLGAAQAPSGAALELPTRVDVPRSQDGRHYPLMPASPAAVASLLNQVEVALRDPVTPAKLLPRLGHQHQMIVRQLSRQVALAQHV